MKRLFPLLSLGLASLGTSTLMSCSSPTPIANPSSPPIAASPPATTSASPTLIPPTSAPARITEIRKQPVWVRPVSTVQEISAQEGMGLQVGEIIRTQGEAAAQVNLKNGVAFRIRGDASLKIQPDSRLNLTAGDMITWVQPGQTVPAEIITPTAVAGIRGTTVFVRIPSDPKGETEFFSWEGIVAVRLVGQTEEILLKTGEEVRIRRGETDINQIRQRVRRFTPQEFAARRRTGRLIRGFKQPLPTLKLIETLDPGQLSSDIK